MSMAMPVLETGRLVMRRFIMEDLDDWRQIVDIDLKMEVKTLEKRKQCLHTKISDLRM